MWFFEIKKINPLKKMELRRKHYQTQHVWTQQWHKDVVMLRPYIFGKAWQYKAQQTTR